MDTILRPRRSSSSEKFINAKRIERHRVKVDRVRNATPLHRYPFSATHQLQLSRILCESEEPVRLDHPKPSHKNALYQAARRHRFHVSCSPKERNNDHIHRIKRTVSTVLREDTTDR